MLIEFPLPVEDGHGQLHRDRASDPPIGVSPASVSVNVIEGQQTSTPAIGIGGGPTSVSVSASGQGLNGGSASAPGSFSAAVDATNLRPGSYSGTLTFNCIPTACTTTPSVVVTINVTPASPGDPLGLDTTSVGFSTAAGKSPPPQQVTLSNTTRTAVQISLTVTSDQNWLSASINPNPVPAGGTAIVTLSVNSSKLAGGSYTGMIVLTGGGAQKTIAVGLVVIPPLSVGLSLPTLAFMVTTVGTSPSSQMFPVTNLTASSLAVAVTTSIVPNPHYRANWLSAAPAQFNLSPGGSQNITATVDSSMLGVGTYTGMITITANSYSQSIPVMIAVSGGVNITVTPNRVDLAVSPGEMVRTPSFVITVDPGIASVIVTGSGPGVAGISVRLNAPGSFSVAVDATSLGPGQANGVLNISCAGVPTCIPEVVPVTITVGASSTGPTIQSAMIASDFGGLKTLGGGTYIEIYGNNLAPQGVGRGLSASDFVNNKAPVILEGVSVKINGQAAYVYFVSPGQVNVLLPDGVPAGSVGLTLENSLGTSNSFQANSAPLQPTLLAPAGFVIGGKQYLEALASPDPLTYALPVGALPGVLSRPAKPGEIVVFYGLGFGDVTPAVPIGLIAPSQSTTLMLPVQILFGQTSAKVSYQGLVASFVSLYQFNVEVPPLADSDAVPVTFTVGGWRALRPRTSQSINKPFLVTSSAVSNSR